MESKPYLESQVARNNRPLHPQVAHNSSKIALMFSPLALQVCRAYLTKGSKVMTRQPAYDPKSIVLTGQHNEARRASQTKLVAFPCHLSRRRCQQPLMVSRYCNCRNRFRKLWLSTSRLVGMVLVPCWRFRTKGVSSSGPQVRHHGKAVLEGTTRRTPCFFEAWE